MAHKHYANAINFIKNINFSFGRVLHEFFPHFINSCRFALEYIRSHFMVWLNESHTFDRNARACEFIWFSYSINMDFLVFSVCHIARFEWLKGRHLARTQATDTNNNEINNWNLAARQKDFIYLFIGGIRHLHVVQCACAHNTHPWRLTHNRLINFIRRSINFDAEYCVRTRCTHTPRHTRRQLIKWQMEKHIECVIAIETLRTKAN